MDKRTRMMAKFNCCGTFNLYAVRVAHLKRRLTESGMTAAEAVIVIINVNDPYGGPLADALMPGHNWQPCRDRGEVPYACGLAGREGIQGVLEHLDVEAAAKLRTMDGIAVVVVDHGVAEVFSV